MRIISLHLQNFMCYRNAFIDFPNSKLVNIYGLDLDRNTANGIGKSALKEAILFALYGKTKVNLSEVIRKGNNKSICTVTLIFETYNKKIEVKRSYDKNTSLDIKVNGDPLKFEGVREKVSYLENLVGMNYEDLINFSIFDAIRFEDLSSLSSSEIKRLLTMLFNYDRFNKTYDNLRDIMRNHEYMLSRLQQRNIHYYSIKRESILKRSLDLLNGLIKKQHNRIEIMHQLRYKIGGMISSKQTIIDKNKKFIALMITKDKCPTCETPLTNKTNILNKHQIEINECQKDINVLNGRLVRVMKYTEQYNVIINTLSQKVTNINNSLAILNNSKQQNVNIAEIEEEHAKYKMTIEVMKKFESFILEHYINYLEQVINEFLEKLTDITCKISLLKQGELITRNIDKLYMKVYRDNQEYTYMGLSSGERMLVAYAFKLAINVLNFKNTFLFIDEGLNRLDINNRQKLIELLQDSPFNQIFLISHNDRFENIPVIYIEKKNNESSIKVL